MVGSRGLLFEEILNQQVNLFIEAIRKKCSIDSRAIQPFRADYPVFRPENDDFYRYGYYMSLLEWYVRDYLITGVLCPWFEMLGYQCVVFSDEGKRIRFSYSNEQFGNDYPLAFIIKDSLKTVGVRYSRGLDDRLLRKCLKKYTLDYVEIIDWSDTNALSTEKEEWSVSPKLRSKAPCVTLRQFMNEYFPTLLYFTYIRKVRTAVSIAREEIGFKTIPNLTQKYFSDFRSGAARELREYPLNRCKYEIFDEDGNPTGEYCDFLSEEDYNTVKERCIANDLISSLVGNEKYATCFLSSEYLYQIFKDGHASHFDYSTIVSGYFKSIELLLERIMKLTYLQPDHDRLFITCNNVRLPENIQSQCPKSKSKYKKIPFREENEEYFSTEMGSLITFLADNESIWANCHSKNTVLNCLRDYNKHCRNGHFHKHLIDNLATLSAIRNNTIICLFYLLGLCIPDDALSSIELTCDAYDRLYKKIRSLPQKNYYFSFDGTEEIKAILLSDQEDTQYDNGSIMTSLEFARVDDFQLDDYQQFIDHLSDENLLIISRENTPKRAWWYTKQAGKVELSF